MDSYSRDPYPHQQESRQESWDRDRGGYDDRQQTGQYTSPYPFGRSRGPDPFRGRYEPPAKGGGERDRVNYRPYPEQSYSGDQARYRERGLFFIAFFTCWNLSISCLHSKWYAYFIRTTSCSCHKSCLLTAFLSWGEDGGTLLMA